MTDITIRIRISKYEFEVTGPRRWAETMIAKYIRWARARIETLEVKP